MWRARLHWSAMLGIVGGVGCGPALIEPLADSDSDSPSETSSTGELETSSTGDPDVAEGSTSDPEPATCPCREEPADWMWCDDTVTAAADSFREPIESAEVPDGNTRRFAVHAGTIYMVLHEGNLVSKASLYAWTPGDDTFVQVDPLGEDYRVYAMGADDAGLVVLYQDRLASVDTSVARWTPEGGHQIVAALDDEAFTPRERGVLQVGGGHALVGAQPRDWDEPWPEDADAVLDVDLSDGSVEFVAEPLSGVVPHAGGWWARRPTLEPYQYCFDYGCFQPLVATSWSVVSADGETVLDAEICVEHRLGEPVTHAWVDDGAYLFVTAVSARLVDASGERRTLWQDGEIDDAWSDGDSLWLTTSRTLEDGAPGEGRNELIRIDLASFEAERWLDDAVDDVRDDIEIAGRLGDRLYLSRPRADGSRTLVALDVSP